MSLSQKNKIKASGQPSCSEYKWFLPRNRISTFCKADNNTAFLDHETIWRTLQDVHLLIIQMAAPSNQLSGDVICAFSNFGEMMSGLISRLGSLEARLESIETRLD